MTEEENKAIELIGCLNLNESYIITSKQWNEQDVHKAIDIILNLIEKLQSRINKRDNEIIELEESAEKEFLTKQEVKENYIPKDKIIKSIDKDIAEWKKLMLSDENDRTKNIWSIECNARRSAYEELLEEK